MLKSKFKICKRKFKKKNKKISLIGVKSSSKDLLKQINCLEKINLIRLLILFKQNQKNRLQNILMFFIMEIIQCFNN